MSEAPEHPGLTSRDVLISIFLFGLRSNKNTVSQRDGIAFRKVCSASESGDWSEKQSGFRMILEHRESEILKIIERKRYVIFMVLHERLPFPHLIFRHGITDGEGVRIKVT